MNKNFEFKQKPIEKLKADYSRRKLKELNSFIDFEEFEKWYKSQNKVCHYCGLKEEECQKIVMNGLLTSKRFPQYGILGRGQSRGVWLEVDRIDPKENYSIDNCVLSCYFCNNDKSDVFNGDDYKDFTKNRVGFLRKILSK